MAGEAAAAAAAAQQALDAAGQVQVNLDNALNAANKSRLVLTMFSGQMDAMATRAFIKKVDGYQTVTHLTDAETAQAVAFAMLPGSNAEIWLTNEAEMVDDQTRLWTTLKPLLTARFTPTLTESEKAAAADACRQTKGADVMQFLDLCKKTAHLLDRDVPEAEKTNANAAPYLARWKKGVLALFLRGLTEAHGLKSHVNGAMATDLDSYLAAAQKYERHVAKVKVHIAELDEDSDDSANDTPEIAAVRAKLTKKYGGKKANGPNGERGNKRPRAGNANNQRKPQDGVRRCWVCNSTQHVQRNCDKKPHTAGAAANPRRNNGGYNGPASYNGPRRNNNSYGPSAGQADVSELEGIMARAFANGMEDYQRNHGGDSIDALSTRSDQHHYREGRDQIVQQQGFW